MQWTHDDKLEEVKTAPFGAELVRDDTRIIRRPGWYQVITPSTGTAAMNEVVHSEIAEPDADRVINDVLAQYASAGTPFKWVVSPMSRPLDLGDRLAKRGLSHWAARGMCIELESKGRALPPGVEVVKVDRDSADVYAETSAEGWSVDASTMTDACRAALSSPEAKHHLHVARYEGAPAGTAGWVDKKRSAYLVGAVVLPAHRRRGVYRALIDARLDAIAERGITLATTHARETTSAPILQKLGFETMYRYELFTNAM